MRLLHEFVFVRFQDQVLLAEEMPVSTCARPRGEALSRACLEDLCPGDPGGGNAAWCPHPPALAHLQEELWPQCGSRSEAPCLSKKQKD